MKRLIGLGLCVALLMPATLGIAEDARDATYAGGTAVGIREGAAGTVDTTAPQDLRFHAGATELSVPYEQMTRIEYRTENRFRLGVVGTIVVGMMKARSKVHTVTITWKDDKGAANVVTLEMSRERATALLDVLKAKAHVVPTVCEVGFNQSCARPK